MKSKVWFFLFWGLVLIVIYVSFNLYQKKSFMDGFFDLDSSIQKSNEKMYNAIDDTNKVLVSGLDNNPELKKIILRKIEELRVIIDDFSDQVDFYKKGLMVVCTHGKKMTNEEIRNEINLIESKKSFYFDSRTGQPKASKDKDWTTWWMVEQHQGDSLELLVRNTHKKLIHFYNETIKECQIPAKLKDDEVAQKINKFLNVIALKIDDSWKETSDKNTWVESRFDHMPFAACMPTLEKIKSDARATEAFIVNDLAKLVNPQIVKDIFYPILNAKNGCITQGEKFKAQLALGSFSTQLIKTSYIVINGKKYYLNEKGLVYYEEIPSKVGVNEINMEAVVLNPLTGETTRSQSSFQYQVKK